ncbi:putative ribonuclease H-like domain-containing protein [Tanacetum coccineum]
MPARMQSPYGKLSRIGLEATRNQKGKKMQKDHFQADYENFPVAAFKSRRDWIKPMIVSKAQSLGTIFALIMRNKSDLDTLSMDDLYNNLKVYESEIKGQSSSSSNSQNVTFVSSDNSSSTNETANIVHNISAASYKDQASTASYADDVMFSFFSYQSNAPQLDNEDLEYIDADDLKEIDHKWQVAMLTMRVKRFIKKTRRKLDLNGKEIVGFDRTTVECYNRHKRARKVVHEKNEAVYEENITFLKNDVQVKYISIKDLKNQLEEALKEKDDLKLKLEKFEESSKNLTKLINSQISAKDKTGLGYDSQMNESELNNIHMNESEVVHSVFNSRESDVDDSPVNDRFKTGKGFHVVLPPYTGNYKPPRPDLSFAGLDESVFQSAVRKTTTSVLETETSISKTTVATKSGQVPVNAAKQSSPRAATSISTIRPVNTATPKPKVKDALPITYSYFKAHYHTLPVRKNFNQKSAAKTNNFNEKVNTARVNNVTTAGPKVVVSATERKWENAVNVLFTETECLVLSSDFKLLDESQVLLKVPRHDNMYSFDLKNVVPSVTKPYNKTPYELLNGRPLSISFMRPFGCPVTILNTLDPLGKFDGKADEGFLVGYSINSKAFRVFNTRTRKVEENLHITFLENKPNVAGSRPDWLFDIDLLTNSMNYEPVTAGNQTNRNAGIKDNVDAVPTQQYILLPSFLTIHKTQKMQLLMMLDLRAELDKLLVQQKEGYANNTNRVSTVSPSISAAGQSFVNDLLTNPLMHDLEDTTDLLNTSIFSGAYDDEDVGAEVDLNNLEITMNVSPIPTTRIHKDHPKDQIIRDINSGTQTRRMTKIYEEHAMIEAMQDELLQFRLQKVWRLVNLLKGKHAIGTKWVYRNKKDKRGIVVKNKARLVAQGYTQEEGIDYDEGFALVARIEAIRLFLAYASFMGFIVYQMDVKSAFLYGTIEEEVYVCEPPSFEDFQFPNKVYKVEKALYGLQQAPRAWYETLSTYLLENRFRRGTIDKTLFIKKNKDDAQEILDEFYEGAHFLLRVAASTLIETNKELLKDKEAEDVDVHLYRSMIRSLMYLTASIPDLMFAVCACARFQVTPKFSHLHAVKRIFRYLKVIILKLALTGNPQQEVVNFLAKDGISDEFGVKTGSCKVNATRQDLVLLGESRTYGNVDFHGDRDFSYTLPISYALTLMQIVVYILLASLLVEAGRLTRELISFGIAYHAGQALQEDTQLPQTSVPIPNVADEAVFKEWDDRAVRATTTAASLDTTQASGNISKTQSMVMSNNPLSQEIGSADRPMCQEAMRGVSAQTRSERASIHSYDSPLLGVNTPGSDEERIEH